MVKFAVAIPLALYYIVMIAVFTFSGSIYSQYDTSEFNDFYDTQENINGGTFDWLDYGVNLLAFIGVGFIPDASLPFVFQFLFSTWCILINIIAFLVFIQILRGS